ncbi:hypothetical protein PsYK624_172840 [Phanerochaete sordida]|uniref:Uncharacterized protein n=1 Tax=Phanerochaete sordida TaxID=48140 RepID=A0A9P3GVE2_9APHY|nr:hypothetical protein PsYK624_172840 [Phanerochaete sordida]
MTILASPICSVDFISTLIRLRSRERSAPSTAPFAMLPELEAACCIRSSAPTATFVRTGSVSRSSSDRTSAIVSISPSGSVQVDVMGVSLSGTTGCKC